LQAGHAFKQNREARMRREQEINSKPTQQQPFHSTHTHESKRTGLPAALSLTSDERDRSLIDLPTRTWQMAPTSAITYHRDKSTKEPNTKHHHPQQ